MIAFFAATVNEMCDFNGKERKKSICCSAVAVFKEYLLSFRAKS